MSIVTRTVIQSKLYLLAARLLRVAAWGLLVLATLTWGYANFSHHGSYFWTITLPLYLLVPLTLIARNRARVKSGNLSARALMLRVTSAR